MRAWKGFEVQGLANPAQLFKASDIGLRNKYLQDLL